jgi:hypothetical protein
MPRASQPYDLSQLPPASWQIEEGGKGSFAVLDKIEVSPNDDRQYRFLTLGNGLRALLISDSKTDKGAFPHRVFRSFCCRDSLTPFPRQLLLLWVYKSDT